MATKGNDGTNLIFGIGVECSSSGAHTEALSPLCPHRHRLVFSYLSGPSPTSSAMMKPEEILSDWCQWLGISIQRAVLIMGVPEDCEDQEFQETVHAALHHLGRYWLLGKVYREEINAKVALVEFAESPDWIPKQIQGKGGPWNVVTLAQAPDFESPEGSSFPSSSQGQASAARSGEPQALGAAGGAATEEEGEYWAQTVTQVLTEATTSSEESDEAVAGPSGLGMKWQAREVAGPREAEEGAAGATADTKVGDNETSDEEEDAGPSEAARAVSSLCLAGVAWEAGAAMVSIPGEGAGPGRAESTPWPLQWRPPLVPEVGSLPYQELRPFSGVLESECCSEPFESWLHHASDTMFLWRQEPEEEQLRRLMESLGGPALDVVLNLIDQNPQTRVPDCLGALVQVFSSQDPQVTARLKLVTCTQGPREPLFAYVMRLEGRLQVALEKGAINPSVIHQLRARQVLMQARPNPVLRRKLGRLRMERRPPGFVAMLQLVRDTEAESVNMSEEVDASCLAEEAGPGPGHGAEAAPMAASARRRLHSFRGARRRQTICVAALSRDPESMAQPRGQEAAEKQAGTSTDTGTDPGLADEAAPEPSSK